MPPALMVLELMIVALQPAIGLLLVLRELVLAQHLTFTQLTYVSVGKVIVGMEQNA